MSRWRRPHLGSETDRATFRTLHTASLASPALREGLTSTSAERSIRHLHDLLGTPAVALSDIEGSLAWHGAAQHHQAQSAALARATVERGSTRMFDRVDLPCTTSGCPVRTAVVSPLVVEEQEISLHDYPRFDNPYCQSRFAQTSFAIQRQGETLVIEF